MARRRRDRSGSGLASQPTGSGETSLATVGEHEREKPQHRTRPVWARILAYARPYLGLVALALLLTFVSSGAEFGRAYLLKPLLDDVILPYGATEASQALQGWLPVPGPPEEAAPDAAPPLEAPEPAAEAARRAEIRRHLVTILMVAALVMLVLPLASIAQEYVSAYALGRINVDMKRDACAKLLALPLGFHTGRKHGDVYSRAVQDVSSAHGVLGLLFSDIVQSAVKLAVGVGFLFYVSWRLSLISLLIGPLIFGVISLFGLRIKRTATARQQQFAEVTQNLLEILSGIKVIKAFRAEAAEDSAYRRETRTLFKRSMKVTKNRLMARGLVELLNQFTIYGVLVLGILLLGSWRITVGDLLAFFLISSQAYRPVKKLAKAWVQIMDAYAGAERFFEVMDTPVQLRDAPDAIELPPLHQSVAMRGVGFGYRDEPVLRDVSFEARAGEVVALVGRTGVGKTTLADLLMRFHDPTEGVVEIDGIDLRRVTRDSLLAQMALVGQEPFLFDGTIRENLLYGRPDATEEELLAAARAAQVEEFAARLPEGYETEVGASGVRLSGGQRQRITIGRAILKDPAILILDEATSNLDSQSEKYVQSAIDALLGGSRTVFVIAHRLSTVRRADRILVIEDGTITQQGSHDELVERGGLYRDLIELQGGRDGAAQAGRTQAP